MLFSLETKSSKFWSVKYRKTRKKMASVFVSKDVLIIVYFAVTIATLTPFSNWFMHCSTTDLERFSDNYFKLKQTKNKLKLVVRDYSCFFMRKIPWKLSLVCTTLSRYIRHIWLDVGWNKFDIFWEHGVVAWQGNFRLFFVHILLILNTVFYTFIKQFSLEKIAENFLEMTKVMPDEKIYLYLKFNYI